MKYLAAYALLSLSGKKDINAADVKKVLGEVSANVSDDDLNRAIASLKGKNIQTLIADGLKKVGDSGPAPAKGGKTQTKAKEVKEAPKKEAVKQAPKKKQEPKPAADQEQDFGLGGGLFD